MDSSRHIEVVAERADALIGAAAPALSAPVPSCPGWTVADLVRHIGSAWGWAADTVATRQRAQASAPPEVTADEALLAWASANAHRLVETLRLADLDADCWTFGLPRSARFWARRQAMESTLHAWDVEAATGRPGPIDPDLAADGVDEHLTVLVPRMVRRHPEGWEGQTVHLHRTDGDGEWFLALGPGGEVDARRAHAKGDVAVRGPAEGLWLWCTGRRSAAGAGLDVVGDASLAQRWSSGLPFD